jgi:hypothetical protein
MLRFADANYAISDTLSDCAVFLLLFRLVYFSSVPGFPSPDLGKDGTPPEKVLPFLS